MKKSILLLLAAAFLASCSSDSPFRNDHKRTRSKYWFGEYFYPNVLESGYVDFKKIVINGKKETVMDSTKFHLYFDYRGHTAKYTYKENKAKFLEYAQAYHEKGDTLFSHSIGYIKPVGITSMRMYVIRNENHVDVSDNILVKYRNDSIVIANHYSKEAQNSPERLVEKKLSELTKYDYKWFPREIYFDIINKEIDRYWLNIKMDNGVNEWVPFNYYLKEEHKKH